MNKEKYQVKLLKIQLAKYINENYKKVISTSNFLIRVITRQKSVGYHGFNDTLYILYLRVI